MSTNRGAAPPTLPGGSMTTTIQHGHIAPDLKILAALLTSAFEGGSDYWAEVQKCNKPDSLDFMLDGPDGAPYPHVDYPLNEGGSVVVLDVTARPTYELTIDSCLKGCIV